MITNQQKDIAQSCMHFALKNGCREVRVSLIASEATTLEYRNEQLDKLQQSTENKLFIELFVDNRKGSFTTNRLQLAEVHKHITEGIAATRFLGEDPHFRLPHSDRYYKGDGYDLELYDANYPNISINQKMDLLRNANAEVLGKDPRLISVTSTFDDNRTAEYTIASNGLEEENIDSAFTLSSEVALKTDTDARPESFWYDSHLFWHQLDKQGIAQKALQRALGKIGQRQAPSGRYQMLLDNTQASRMVSPIISAMMGTALQQKNSFLLNKLGSPIASPLLSITDTPHLKQSFGARWCDGEGVATQVRSLVSEGVLNTYFINTYNAGKMQMAPTVSAPSVLQFTLGDKSFDELLAGVQRGIWVSGFNGGNTNPATGDFSFGVEGFLIENGTIIQPVGEMNITGNLLNLWNNLLAVGNDPRQNSPWKVPSFLFGDVAFNGV